MTLKENDRMFEKQIEVLDFLIKHIGENSRHPAPGGHDNLDNNRKRPAAPLLARTPSPPNLGRFIERRATATHTLPVAGETLGYGPVSPPAGKGAGGILPRAKPPPTPS